PRLFTRPAKYPCKPARTPSEISGRRSFVLQMAWTRMLARDCGIVVSPFQGLYILSYLFSQGVALGCHVLRLRRAIGPVVQGNFQFSSIPGQYLNCATSRTTVA